MNHVFLTDFFVFSGTFCSPSEQASFIGHLPLISGVEGAQLSLTEAGFSISSSGILTLNAGVSLSVRTATLTVTARIGQSNDSATVLVFNNCK